MTIKSLFSTLFLLMVGTAAAFAQGSLLRGTQVTQESDLVSGKPYLLYYVGNKEGAYIKANSNNTYFSVAPNDVEITSDAVFILTKEGSTWKIQSQKTGKYFPIPSGTAGDENYQPSHFEPAESANAGSWTLNFLANGTLAPYYGERAYSLNRSDGILHAFSYGEADVNQLKIYELGFIADATKVYTVKDNQGNGVANISNSWAFVSTGFANYYYMYNTDAKQFAYPTANGEWTLSKSAVPVSVNYHSIITKDGVTFKIGNETNLTIEKTDDAVNTTELNAAKAKLMGGQTEITDASEISDGWYALHIIEDSEHPEYEGNFLYTLETPYDNGGTLYYPYPIGHGGTYLPHPANDDATYYFRLWPVGTRDGITYYHWQLPNGIYIVNYNNNFPIRYHQDLSDFIIGKNTDGTFYIQSSDFRTKAFDEYIGKTAHKYMESSTKLGIRKIDLSSSGANITPWKVVFNEGADDIPLTYTRTDVKGLNTVYNNGYFFLPSDVTPSSSDFDTSAPSFAGSAVVNASDHTINVTYAPDICFTADNVSVAQGSRTTGIGNTKQVLLRVKVEPQAPCKLSSLEVTLAGAEQFDRVETYLTSADQLHADGVSSTLLGSKSSGLTGDSNEPLGNITIELTTNTPVLRMGETYYVWLTADIKSGAQESEIVDAAIVDITYTNAKNIDKQVNLTSKGDPEGNMRIFKAQSFVKVSAENNGTEAQYYRNPAILNIGKNTVLAFCDYRYDNVNGLGKYYDGSNYGHRMDVIVRKSTDNGKIWGNAVTIAAGTEGATPSGYAGPAVAMSGSKIICLMANDSPDRNTPIAINTSTDGGDTWPNLADLTINWGNLNPTSIYVTPGKGITYSDGHVAFVINANVGGKLQEYLLYSDVACSSWTVDPTPLSGKGKESKLQLKNDGSLLVMGKTPVSKDCNNDLLSFKRSGDDNTSYDVILQTVIWKNDGGRLKDMRLYASFDQATTWKELFYIQPGNGATSSMQKLSSNEENGFDGDLAICFEDGSIGNDEKDGCYALTYVVIGETMIGEQTVETNTATIIATGVTARTAPNVNGSGWTKSVVTNKASGFPDITISANHAAFNREGTSQRYFIIKPSAAGASDVITITAPPGYVIKSYSITGEKKSSSENYTLTSENNTATATFNEGSPQERTLAVDNVFSPSTTFTFKSNSGTNSSYSLISDFTIVLAREEYGVKLNRVNDNGTGKSYATLYTEYDLRQTDETTKAYYITEVTDGKVVLSITNNEGRDIPKNTAVVLINSDGNTYTEFTLVSSLDQVVSEGNNLLKGTLASMTLDMATNDNYYSLGRRHVRENENSAWGDYVAGFYNTGESITLGANRAYLDTTNAKARNNGFDLAWGDGDTTSIADEPRVKTHEVMVDTPYYTLDGRKISGKPTTKGIYIKDRKKVIIK